MKALFTSLRQDWRTPKAFYQSLDAEFNFTFDPCPKLPSFDGLSCEWGERSFCNPPYKDLKKWIPKAFLEAKKGKIVVLLVPARTDTIWWHEYCLKAQEIRFIKGRLSFDDDGGRATFPSAIIIFRNQNEPR